MNAIDILKLDHRVVDALFQKAMSMQPSKRGPVYKKISNELASHAHIEEAIFYPRLLKKGDKELKKIVLEGIEEHSQIHMFHDQLDTMKPGEERFEPKLTVLQEDIRHHVKEEENEMFEMVEDQFSSEELDQLGEELEAERKRYQKQKGIPARTKADEDLGKGMLSRMVDAITGIFTEEGEASKAKRSTGSKKSRSKAASAKASSSSGSPRKTSAARSTKKAASPKSSRSSTSSSSRSAGSTSVSRSTKKSTTGNGSKATGNGGNGKSAKGGSRSSASSSSGKRPAASRNSK